MLRPELALVKRSRLNILSIFEIGDYSTVEKAAGRRREDSLNIRFIQTIHALPGWMAKTTSNLFTETD